MVKINKTYKKRSEITDSDVLIGDINDLDKLFEREYPNHEIYYHKYSKAYANPILTVSMKRFGYELVITKTNIRIPEEFKKDLDKAIFSYSQYVVHNRYDVNYVFNDRTRSELRNIYIDSIIQNVDLQYTFWDFEKRLPKEKEELSLFGKKYIIGYINHNIDWYSYLCVHKVNMYLFEK